MKAKSEIHSTSLLLNSGSEQSRMGSGQARKVKRSDLRRKILVKVSHFIILGVLLCFAFNALHLTLAPKAQAFTMSSSDWIIEMGDFVTSAGKSSDGKVSILSTTGQTGPGVYSGKNYTVRSGFFSIYPLSPFSFSISDTLIDFGLLSPTTPVNRTAILSLSNPSSTGYQIVAYENNPLVNEAHIAINDTTCDNGSCSETTSAPWNNNLTYGLGYRCDPVRSVTCSSTFTEPDYYRQFADAAKGESPQTIINGRGAGKDRSAKITYKLNISGTQMTGIYSNTITYIAAPTF